MLYEVHIAVSKVLALGAGTMMAKFDVEGAYRTVPVHPEHRWLLGMKWEGKLYVDKVLPFVPPKFTMQHAMQWILGKEWVDVIHYLDVFFMVGDPNSGHRVRLNRGFRSNLCWWACFLPGWNGTSMMASVVKSSQVVLTSDASGSWGCGVFTSAGECFQLELLSSWDGIHITIKELLPIVIGAAVWGSQWRGMSVRCLCDNAAVVAIVNSGRSKVERVMHLMRSLSFFLARWNVVLVC